MTYEEFEVKKDKSKEDVIVFVEYSTREMLKEFAKPYPNKSRVNRLRKEINRAVVDHFKYYKY